MKHVKFPARKGFRFAAGRGELRIASWNGRALGYVWIGLDDKYIGHLTPREAVRFARTVLATAGAERMVQ